MPCEAIFFIYRINGDFVLQSLLKTKYKIMDTLAKSMQSLLKEKEHLSVHQREIAQILEERWKEGGDDGYDFSGTGLPFAFVSSMVTRNPEVFFKAKRGFVSLRSPRYCLHWTVKRKFRSKNKTAHKGWT